MYDNNLAHSKISPTAKMVAYWRATADLPFSSDVSELSGAKETVDLMFKNKKENKPLNQIFVTYIELRYKSMQKAILDSGIKQVLEFASGVSLRGLAMTEDPALTYVESDLPGITEEKLRIVEQIKLRHKLSDRPNLHFATVNILDLNAIHEALKSFDSSKPIMIVHEGLLQYLTKEEKTVAAENISEVLKLFGGVWVTPDFDTEEDAVQHEDYSEEIEEMFTAVRQATNRSLEENRFKDDAEVYSFLEERGFKVQKKTMWSSELNLKAFDGKRTEVLEENLKKFPLWFMTLA